MTGAEGELMTSNEQSVRGLLAEHFDDRVYAVEDGVVWVSGMNSNCPSVARRMADRLISESVPCSLVYDDDAARFGGVEFRYGEGA